MHFVICILCISYSYILQRDIPFFLQIKYADTVVEEINKRELGKLIVNICGNEGCQDPSKNESMRKPLQIMISEIDDKKYKPKVWKNASINLYDEDGNVLHIESGGKKLKKNRFIVQTRKGEWEVEHY